MKLKKGVRLHGIRPEMIMVLMVAYEIYNRASTDLVVTSVIEGKHSRGSLHYVGQAVDLRRPPDELVNRIMLELENALPTGFDVVLEPTHIHIEFQPKESYEHGRS